MNEEKNWSKLYDKYPILFENRHKTPMESCMSFGIECNLGWYDLISSLCWIISDYEKNLKNDNSENKKYISVKFDQVKEKFGGLRVYYSGGDDCIRGAIRMAEEMSYKICEVCGNSGRPNKQGWIATLCENCRNESQKQTTSDNI